jgi:hypothetical protein
MEIMREWVKKVVEQGDADRDISKFVLSKSPFADGPDPIKDIIIKRCMGATGRSIGPQVRFNIGWHMGSWCDGMLIVLSLFCWS